MTRLAQFQSMQGLFSVQFTDHPFIIHNIIKTCISYQLRKSTICIFFLSIEICDGCSEENKGSCSAEIFLQNVAYTNICILLVVFF
jgi:hypothetical protein